MAADLGYWLAIPVRVARGVALAVITLVVIVVTLFFILVCVLEVELWWQSPRMRLFRLGGATTLRRNLDYPCTLCQDSMEAGEKVRTLSCDHVFHCGATAKCENGIDEWLLTAAEMSCPICRQIPRPVPRGKQPPPSSPAPSSPRTSSATHSPPSSPAPSSPRTSSASNSEEEELLFPSHWFDETLPEGSPSQ